MAAVHEYYVYIVSNLDGSILYVGVTSELALRLKQHATGAFGGYTSANGVSILRYYEKHNYIRNAIGREKYIKGLLRERKIALIETVNPEWRDLTSRFLK